MSKETIVILGNGIAGLTSAMTIREKNKECDIILIGKEVYLSYSRPMLTKAPLKGFDISKFIIKDEAWYKENNIVTLTNKEVIEIDTNHNLIKLDDKSSIKYDKCVYALGAESFIPPLQGNEKEGVFTIRGIDDIARLRTSLLTAKNAVVIGGGVVGLEAAWELKKIGLHVTVLEQAPNLMGRLLDTQSAKVLENIVVNEGITVRTGVQVEAITGEDRANGVALADGTKYPADLVVLSCGIKANTEVAEKSGIKVNRAVVVNEKMETSVKGIYACGDCAEYNGMNYGLWEQSVKQGEVAGANICGDSVNYEGIDVSLLFNGIKTSLFSIGDLGAGSDYTEITHEEYNKKPDYFMVNNPLESDYCYEKYYLKNNHLVGGVLIGDLSKMALLRNGIKNKISFDEFDRTLNRKKVSN